MGNRFALVAVVVGALACGGSGAKQRSPDAKLEAKLPRPNHLVAPLATEAPQELFGVLVVPNVPAALEAINTFYSEMAPGNPPIGTMLLDLAVGNLVGARSIAGIDYEKPVRLLFLDPASSERWVAAMISVQDEQALRAWATADGVAVDVRGSIAIVGSPEAIATVADYAATNLAVKPLPDHITATAFVERIRDKYSEELSMLLDGFEEFIRADPDPKVAAAAKLYAEAFYSLVSQTDTVSVAYELTPKHVALVFEVAGAPGSTLANVAAIQRPSDYTILDVFNVGDAPIGLAGEVDWGPLQQEFSGLIEVLLPELASNDEARAAWVDLMKQYAGQFVLYADLGPFSFASAYAVENPEEALRLNRIYEAANVNADSGYSLKPIGRPSFTHRGVPVDVYKMQFDKSKAQPQVANSRVAQWLSAGYSATATVGGYIVTVASANAAESMKGRIDAFESGVRGTASKGPSPAASRERRESLLMWLDIGAVSAAISPSSPAFESRLDFGIGFTDTSWLFRVSMSMNDVITLTRVMSSLQAATSAQSSNLVADIDALTDEACACADMACAEVVQAKLMDLVNDAAEPSKSDHEIIMRSMERMGECMAKLAIPLKKQ